MSKRSLRSANQDDRGETEDFMSQYLTKEDLKKALEEQTKAIKECFKQELDGLREIIDKQQEEIKQLKIETESLTESNIHISRRQDDLKKALEEQTKAIKECFKQELDGLREIIDKQQEEIKQLKIETESLTESNIHISRRQDDLSERITALEDMNKNTTISNIATNNVKNRQIQSNLSKPNEIILFGLKETTESSYKVRFESLRKDLTKCIEKLNCNTEENVTDFFRLGKYKEGKNRPVLIRLNSIWTKRKLLAEYNKQKSNQQLEFEIKENVADSEKFLEARRKAKELNETEKAKAMSLNETVKTSYSPRHDGSIIKYTCVNNKWIKQQ